LDWWKKPKSKLTASIKGTHRPPLILVCFVRLPAEIDVCWLAICRNDDLLSAHSAYLSAFIFPDNDAAPRDIALIARIPI
jgi:hypothetical protein